MTKRAPTKQSRTEPRRRAQPIYPFTSIVGQEEMKLALLLNVIDPAIGGVLIMGHRGTGKSTAVRALADLLPQVWKVRGCHFACDPADAENLCDDCFEQLQQTGKLAREQAHVPVVDLPLGATEDRVCGTINLEQALKSGIKAFEPGLLARANRGFLYVDEVNLLEDHLVDLLLDVAVTGRNTVEREGISLEHPARFVLVGSGNPEEGELRPQLLDRFGLYAEIKTVEDLEQRVKIVELREEFERDPTQFRAQVEAEQQLLRRKILRARKLVNEVTLSKTLLRNIAGLCLRLKIDGHRGELTISRAARALAAFEGRRKVSEEDVRRVAALALRHRLRREPLEPTGGGTRIEQSLDQTFSEAETHPNQIHPDSRTDAQKTSRANAIEHPTPLPLETHLPAEALRQNVSSTTGRQTPKHSSRQQRDTNHHSTNNLRGRYTRAVMHKSQNSKIALDATLRASALNQTNNLNGERQSHLHTAPYALRPDSFRFKKFKRKAGTLFILAIDTSGSMALNRIERAKGALVWLLGKSYVRRDRVALVSFRGQNAEEILPPSQSMSRARRLLDEMLMGGPTPLASALARALDIASRAARQGTARISLLLFTDGRPNVPLHAQAITDKALRQRALMDELRNLGAALRAACVKITLIDTQDRFTSGGEARVLSEHLGASYVYLSSDSKIDSMLDFKSEENLPQRRKGAKRRRQENFQER
jgi:magnesium chelatase subunit D